MLIASGDWRRNVWVGETVPGARPVADVVYERSILAPSAVVCVRTPGAVAATPLFVTGAVPPGRIGGVTVPGFVPGGTIIITPPPGAPPPAPPVPPRPPGPVGVVCNT